MVEPAIDFSEERLFCLKYSQLVPDQLQGRGSSLQQCPQEQLSRLDEKSNLNIVTCQQTESRMEEKVVSDSESEALKTEDEELGPNILMSPDCDATLSNTSLSLASNLERFAISDSIFNRQMVAKSLLDTLRSVINVEDDVTTVLSILLRLSDDAEPTVRAELVDQVPQISAFCLEQTENQKLLDVHPKYLLPLVVKHLSDLNNQVRKTSQTVLLTLVEQKLLTNDQINDHVYPALLRLANLDNLDHCRAEAVALMSRMATLLGKEMAQKLFLDRFVAFCSDSLILVRKMCAVHFGDMCAVLGEEVTENVLLPLFANLCKDGMWGVRKACADVFVTVSCVCLMSTRRNCLAQLFVFLLMDLSRWVRLAAFQALGAFISTFADPNNPYLYYDEEGNIHAACQDVTEEEEDLVPEEINGDSGFGSRVVSNAGSPLSDDVEDMERESTEESNEWRINFENADAQLADVTQRLTLSEVDDFNCFQYWRTPLSEIEIDSKVRQVDEVVSVESSDILSNYLNVEAMNDEQDDGFICGIELGVGDPDVRWQRPPSLMNDKYKLTCHPGNPNTSGSHLTYEEFESLAPSSLREIVPAELLFHYIQMTNTVLLQSLDSEIVRYCAYSFPAVALTLGRIHWPLLRNLYKKLASDMQWKVRRTLAFSIHELAAILGRDLAASDLVPIFDSFIRDLDEVRIGILKHFSSFISLLPVSVRHSYLGKIEEFMEPENERNWRFRLELTQQLSRLCPLYYAEDVAFHLLPIAIRLLQDRVSEVRSSTVKTLAVLVELLSDVSMTKMKSKKKTTLLNESVSNQEEFLVPLAVNLVDQFAHHQNWSRRQTFARCCLQMRTGFPRTLMNIYLLPSILELADDPVANVRLVIAQVLKAMANERSSSTSNWDQDVEANVNSDASVNVGDDELDEKIADVFEKLKNDQDRDVRQAANTVISSLYSNQCDTDFVPSVTESTAVVTVTTTSES